MFVNVNLPFFSQVLLGLKGIPFGGVGGGGGFKLVQSNSLYSEKTGTLITTKKSVLRLVVGIRFVGKHMVNCMIETFYLK